MSRWSALCYIVVLAALFACPPKTASAVPGYSITTLEPLPGGVDSYATGINELGVVVGHSTLDRSAHVGRSRPVMWNALGQPTELWTDPVFGGIPADINNAGQVVGRYGSGSGIPLPGPGIPPGGAFIWDPATRLFTDLGDFGGPHAQATGINESGQVSGSAENFLGEPRAFIWDAANGIRAVGTLGGTWSFGNDINNGGQIAGYSWRADQSEHAYFWDPVGGMSDLGSLGGSVRGFSRAYGINDLAQVVGISNPEGSISGPFVWDAAAGMQPLSLSSIDSGLPRDVNRIGQVVGFRSYGGRVYAALWQSGTGAVDLETLIPAGTGWQLVEAFSINERGQIVGFGLLDEKIRGFVLTPVPEPTAVVLCGWAMCCYALTLRGSSLRRPLFRARLRLVFSVS